MNRMGNKLKKMDQWLRHNISDEELFMRWLYLIPDGASDEDFDEIGEDPEMMGSAGLLFADIVMKDVSKPYWKFK